MFENCKYYGRSGPCNTHGTDFIMDVAASTPFDATSSHLDADRTPFGARGNLSNFSNNSSRSVTPILPLSILLPASLPVRVDYSECEKSGDSENSADSAVPADNHVSKRPRVATRIPHFPGPIPIIRNNDDIADDTPPTRYNTPWSRGSTPWC